MESNGHVPLSVLDRIHRVYSAAPQRILVPELPDAEGRPLELFYTPMTGLDEQTVEGRNPKDSTERVIYRLILKARSDEGKALFRWQDAQVLMRELHFDIALRIVGIMMGARDTVLTVEQAKKDIEADPPSTSDSTWESSSTSP